MQASLGEYRMGAKIPLPYPLSLLQDFILCKEVVLIEYNTAANIELLPYIFFAKLQTDNKLLINIGDRTALKVQTLIDITGLKISGRIVYISNYQIELPNLIRIPISDVQTVISKIYEQIRNFDKGVIIINGTEQAEIYWDLNEILTELLKIKRAIPDTTLICFINHDAVSKDKLTLFEGASTTVFRLNGFLMDDSIKRHAYILKTINHIKSEAVEYDPYELWVGDENQN